MRTRSRGLPPSFLVVVLLAMLTACNGETPPPSGDGTSVSKTIGQSGGTLSLKGLTLEIPQGALQKDFQITITSTKDPAPFGFENYSPLYRFEPSGLLFAKAAKVTIDFKGDTALARVIFSEFGGGRFWEDLGAQISGDKISAPVMHFSTGFAGAKPDCSKFQSFPAPPTWKGPAAHCFKTPTTPPNPGCSSGTGCLWIPPSGWGGPYNIYGDNCHDAASCGVNAGCLTEQTTGILSCAGNTSGPSGHTVNYTVFEIQGMQGATKKYGICLTEPQRTNPSSDKCCWEQDTAEPKMGNGDPGSACYKYRCSCDADALARGACTQGGGTTLPANKCWEPRDPHPCGKCWTADALKCCKKKTTDWDRNLEEWCTEDDFKVQLDFRCQAYIDCVGSAGWPPKESGCKDGGVDSGKDSGVDLKKDGPKDAAKDDGPKDGAPYSALPPEKNWQQRFAVPVGPSRATEVRIAWSWAPGWSPPVELALGSSDTDLLQVFARGRQGYARLGLAVVPLRSGSTYRVRAASVGSRLRLELVDGERTIASATSSRARSQSLLVRTRSASLGDRVRVELVDDELFPIEATLACHPCSSLLSLR